ncbi:MAG: DNA-directed RNA polymerase subunit K [Candidatus Woesearchaeota archaeon]
MPAKNEEDKQKKFTKYEKARIIGARALQLSMGAPFLIKLNDDDLKKIKYNPLEIAKREFEEGIFPIEIARPLPIRKQVKE